MARPLRQLEPGRLWFVTDRCFQTQYLLRPDEECLNVLGYWLALALARFSGVHVLAVVAMSNHLHLVIRDLRGELSAFLECFLGNVARDTNRLRGREGAFFHDRYHAEPILDDEALLGRIVYALANPAKAGLVTTHVEWPGLLAFAGDGRPQTFRRPPRASDDPDMPRPAVALALPAREGDPSRETIVRALAEAETAIAEHRGPRRVLGADNVRRQSPFAAPARPKRSPRPLCHATAHAAVLAFKATWQALVAAHRAASDRWRRGDRRVYFPDHTFAPPVFRPG